MIAFIGQLAFFADFVTDIHNDYDMGSLMSGKDEAQPCFLFIQLMRYHIGVYLSVILPFLFFFKNLNSFFKDFDFLSEFLTCIGRSFSVLKAEQMRNFLCTVNESGIIDLNGADWHIQRMNDLRESGFRSG